MSFEQEAKQTLTKNAGRIPERLEADLAALYEAHLKAERLKDV